MLSDLLDSGGDMPPRLRLHLDSCPRCRRYRQRLAALEAELQAGGEEKSLPAHLRDRIMRAVESCPATATRTAPRTLRLRLAAALAAAACVAAAVTFHAMRREDPRPNAEGDAAGANALAWIFDDLPAPGEMIDLSWDEVQDMVAQPVAEEIHLLTADARAASRSLLACLPLGLGDYGRQDSEDQGTTRSAAWPTRPQ